MSLEVFLAVLAAALLHASWNALIKTGGDRFVAISLMSLGMALISLLALPFVAVPTGITWVRILLSALLHTGYKIYLIKAYAAGDLAQVYPLARGSAPLITAAVAMVLIGEAPSLIAGLAIAVLCVGIVMMSMSKSAIAASLDRSAVSAALITSVFIAGYTLVDGIGARQAVSAASYAAWMFLFDGAWMAIFCVAVRGRSVYEAVLPRWKSGIATGALSIAAYWIVIWAMTKAPIAAVAALRETSILFAMLISVFILREPLNRWRILAAGLILLGVAGLRIG